MRKKSKIAGCFQLPQGTSTAVVSGLAEMFDIHEFRSFLLRWIVFDHIPFKKVESDASRDLLLFCSPLLAAELAPWADIEEERLACKKRKAVKQSGSAEVDCAYGETDNVGRLLVMKDVVYLGSQKASLSRQLCRNSWFVPTPMQAVSASTSISFARA